MRHSKFIAPTKLKIFFTYFEYKINRSSVFKNVDTPTVSR